MHVKNKNGLRHQLVCVFFFNDTATTEIYTLSLHDALPICIISRVGSGVVVGDRHGIPRDINLLISQLKRPNIPRARQTNACPSRVQTPRDIGTNAPGRPRNKGGFPT